jgi:hypothetical protein
VDIGLHCFYEVSCFGAIAGEGFRECSHHSDIPLRLWDLLWGHGWSLRGGRLSSSSSARVSSWVSSSGVSLHAFVPGMLNALAWVVYSSSGGGLDCYGWGRHCLRHSHIFEWHLQCRGCVDWALSNRFAVFLFFLVEVVVRVQLVFTCGLVWVFVVFIYF